MRELVVYVGPVHSEKTTGAALAAGRYQRLGKKVIAVRPARGVRPHETPGSLVAKSGLRFPAADLKLATDMLGLEADVIWLDEPMLFDDEPEVFDVVQALRTRSIVIVSGLSATSELESFGSSMPRLLAVADEIVHCRADCDRCGRFKAATRSVCLRPKTGQVLVGGAETYQASCPECWSKLPATAKKEPEAAQK